MCLFYLQEIISQLEKTGNVCSISEAIIQSPESSRKYSFCWEIVDAIYNSPPKNTATSEWESPLHSFLLRGVGAIVQMKFSQWYKVTKDQENCCLLTIKLHVENSPFFIWVTKCLRSILDLGNRVKRRRVQHDEIGTLSLSLNHVNKLVDAMVLSEKSKLMFKCDPTWFSRNITEGFNDYRHRISSHLIKSSYGKKLKYVSAILSVTCTFVYNVHVWRHDACMYVHVHVCILLHACT